MLNCRCQFSILRAEVGTTPAVGVKTSPRCARITGGRRTALRPPLPSFLSRTRAKQPAAPPASVHSAMDVPGAQPCREPACTAHLRVLEFYPIPQMQTLDWTLNPMPWSCAAERSTPSTENRRRWSLAEILRSISEACFAERWHSAVCIA